MAALGRFLSAYGQPGAAGVGYGAREGTASVLALSWLVFLHVCLVFGSVCVRRHSENNQGLPKKANRGLPKKARYLGYFENIRIFGFFPAARTTPPALSGSGALVGASPVFLAEDIHDFTSKK